MSDPRKKRKAFSVQDVVTGRANEPTLRFKSNYKGPKKSATGMTGRIDLSSSPLKDTTGRISGVTGQSKAGRNTQSLYNTSTSGFGVSKKSIQNTSTTGFGVNARSNRSNTLNDEFGVGVSSAITSTGSININSGRSPYGGGYTPSFANNGSQFRQSGILDYAWILFSVILLICVSVAMISYSRDSKKVEGYVFPVNIPTVSGVVNDIFEEYRAGGLGSKYAQFGSGSESEEGSEETNIPEEDYSGMLGEENKTNAMPNTTTGATMKLDDGTTESGTPQATDFAGFITQIQDALTKGDVNYIGSKFCYEDETSGELIGYPQSVVEHFVTYMQNNSDKRETFISSINDEATFKATNGSAMVLKLPILKFTVNMGYDNTTLSISGFSESVMNSGESAVVSPLLPCMYTIGVSTDSGSQSSEVECNMNEGNLQINIGVAN